MPSVPMLKPQEVIRAFSKHGWRIIRQRGSHIILTKEGHMATLSVPNHPEVARGTLKALISKAGLTIKEFMDSL